MLCGISYSVLFTLNSEKNDAASCISYFALFKLNGEKKRMLYLVFHISTVCAASNCGNERMLSNNE